MHITDYIASKKNIPLVSFEILPPLKGGSMQAIFDILDPLMEFNPPFIDVTYHREEFLYVKRQSGYYEKVAIRKRPGTVGICASIMHRYGVDAVPHLICGGFTREETENALIDLNFLNVTNVLALRGDARRFEDKFVPEDSGHHYAIDLVRQIAAMNSGQYLDENISNGQPTNFCIGIAGYPEKHYEAPNLGYDIAAAKAKIDAGAGFIVTQMFFDNQKYFEYVDLCRAAGITVPIIPGLKPLTKRYQLSAIPRKFYVNMPDELVREAAKCQTEDAFKDLGVAWCAAQSKELIERGAPCLHYYTMGDAITTQKVVSQLF
jgi:methylenetetrahydrofolate reductase (NADPH)